MSYLVDHIVIAVPDLDVAIEDFYNCTGVRPIFGGRHTTLGTMNALIGLDKGAYLELLAIDPDTHVEPPRWMGVDLITESRITRWALKSNDIDRDAAFLSSHRVDLASIKVGKREMAAGGTLEWSLTMPLAAPMIEIAPFFLDWSRSAHHPSDRLETHCTVRSIKLGHADPVKFETLMKHVGYQDHLYHSDSSEIILQIQTPKGEIAFR